jgi:hypothetical protein
MSADRSLGIGGEGLASITANRWRGSFCNSEHIGFHKDVFTRPPDTATSGRGLNRSRRRTASCLTLRAGIRRYKCVIVYYIGLVVKSKSGPARQCQETASGDRLRVSDNGEVISDQLGCTFLHAATRHGEGGPSTSSGQAISSGQAVFDTLRAGGWLKLQRVKRERRSASNGAKSNA